MVTIVAAAFGVAFRIDVDPALERAVRAVLPPGSAPLDPPGDDLPRFTVLAAPGGRVRVGRDGDAPVEAEPVAAFAALDARLRLVIAAGSPGMVFVHAGVVARGDRGIVLPAASLAGKTELVAALLRAGATYLSDEYAVLDPDGRVHPYPRPLSLRERGTRRAIPTRAATLGAATAGGPVHVALIAATRYEPDGSWAPVPRTPADGALLLLAHAGQARAHPERVLETVHRAAAAARVLEGPRGEADPVAAALLDLLG